MRRARTSCCGRALGEQIEIEAILERRALAGAGRSDASSTTALLNLAINARDAMPDGGKLTLETDNVVLDEHYAGTNRDVEPGNYVMIAVSDTGTGIPRSDPRPGVRAVLHDQGRSARAPGLGLSMVYGFVKQSSGHIKIYSEAGHGTTIKIYLPRADARPSRRGDRASSRRSPAAAKPSWSSRTIRWCARYVTAQLAEPRLPHAAGRQRRRGARHRRRGAASTFCSPT